MISESQNNNDNIETIYEDEIDLKPILKILKRSKKTDINNYYIKFFSWLFNSLFF